jgi:preprotein translocase subunit SecD
VLRKLICGVAVSAGCLSTVTSCGLPSVPVTYRTDLVLEVCSSTAPVVATLSPCTRLVTNAAAVRSDVVATLESRSNASEAQSSITIRSDGSVEVRTTLTTAQAVSVFTKTGSIAFATAVAGAPGPGSASFLADQQGRFDARQFSDDLVYPVGYHWKIDSALPGGDITSATVGTDARSGQVTVDINFNAAGATEWTRIIDAAFAAYTAQPADPGGPSQIAIFLDSEVLTAPEVTGGGQSDQTQITGNFTVASATDLADYVSSGALPAPVAIASLNGAGPTPTP